MTQLPAQGRGRAPGSPDRAAPHVVIVTFNSAHDLPALLSDLARELQAIPGATVCVVDNASSDDTVTLARAAGVDVVETGGNLGYAAAINVCVEHADPDATLLVLNPDLRLAPGALGPLLRAAAQPGAGIAVPMVHGEDGARYPSLRHEPRIHRAFFDALLGARMARLPSRLSEMKWDTARYGADTAFAWATGAALAISPEGRRRVGRWDEIRFFLYSEETDYFRRNRAAGLTSVLVPASQVTHSGAGSGTSPDLVALMAVNRVVYFRKYHPAWLTAVFHAVVLLHSALRMSQPGHRRAFHVLARPSRWSQLPGANRRLDGRAQVRASESETRRG